MLRSFVVYLSNVNSSFFECFFLLNVEGGRGVLPPDEAIEGGRVVLAPDEAVPVKSMGEKTT